MTMHAAEFRRCLDTLDSAGARRLWAHVSPHLAQPANDAEALIMLHHARTLTESMTLRARAYSHAWLVERGLPSGLPDSLRPVAERIYPRIVEAVGISVRSSSALMKPIAKAVQSAMSDAVSEVYADGVTDPAMVSARMQEARTKTIRKLLGCNKLPTQKEML